MIQADSKYGLQNFLCLFFSTCRIFGTFEALKGGNMAEAMEDFTGGLTEPYELNDAPKHLFKVDFNNTANYFPIQPNFPKLFYY